MTTLLLDPPVKSLAEGSTEICYAVLTVEGMPRAARPAVEALMVEHLRSPAPAAQPGTDPLDASWCTRWHRDGPRTVRCRQLLAAPGTELGSFAGALAGLAQAEGFAACVAESSAAG
ncbi:hypothetical protein H7347_00905 [Corynebacterium sp. zg-331]|uniref:hypothetical protein n=1 Tax=unclassified Corynebacterium TaxID=2624378 RepID=UPI00128C73E3|nr:MULTISPECIES: hypothetical protein [unclassified Corynebacterium]MBC3185146.1 hypothetical protein [Corynebacterium sp. zg-331]MPV51644.1 hypothetical protein [Corynebacterium sp. zg331]